MLNEASWLEEARAIATPHVEMAARAMLDDAAFHEPEQKVGDLTLIAVAGAAGGADAAAVTAGVLVAVNTVQTYTAQLRHTLEADLKVLKGYTDLIGWIGKLQGFARARSTLIRGGAHRATAVAAQEQAETHSNLLSRTLGRVFSRTWITRGDDRVRETHRAAHGQTQPLGERFQVGDALLRYPGDPEGPPGEVINCRCRLRTRVVIPRRT